MLNMEMMIEELENNGKVIKNVKYANGDICNIEMTDSFENIVALEVVDLDEYEANGYDTDGLNGEWINLQQA